MDAIVELSPHGPRRHGGGWSRFEAARACRLQADAQALRQAEQAADRAADRARLAAERKARKDAAGRRGRDAGGQPKVLLDAAKERAESSKGAAARLRGAREAAAQAALTEAAARQDRPRTLRMELPSTGLPAGRQVLSLRDVALGRNPARPILSGLSLTLTGPERLAIEGPNGAGKSTLAALLCGRLAPLAGKVGLRVPAAMVDQHAALPGDERAAPDRPSLLEAFLTASPDASPHEAHAALARFGFRAADAERRTQTLSGGERLRAALALALSARPAPMLLALDEPTNHLDLEGLEALEAALAAYDGALIAISHDRAFLDRLRLTRRLSLPAPG